MTRKALLISGQESETVSTLARNLIHVGGLSVFARQMKQMKAIGIDEMHVVTDWFIRDFETEILNCSARPEKIFLHNTKDAPLRLLDHNNDGNSWFLIEEGVIVDERIIDQVASHAAPTVVGFIGHNEFLSAHTGRGIPLRLENHDGYFGSIAKISSATLAANIRKLNSLDSLAAALKAIGRARDCEIFNLTEIPLYLAGPQREVDLVWFPVVRREDGNEGVDILLEYSRKGMPDWPARYIYRPIEDLMVKYLCRCPVRPPHVIIATIILALYSLALFWNGHTVPALAGAYIVSILYGVRDKLARITLHLPKYRWPGHLLEILMEYGWYAAIAGYLSTLHGLAPVIMAAALVLFRLADDIQIEFFRRMTNRHICMMSDLDRKFHLIAGGRNARMWALLPFALFNLWYGGFGFICIYGIITFFVHQGRVVYHLKNLMIADNSIFAENVKKTKIL